MPPTPSMFKTPEGQARYFAAYDATLALWPVPVTSLEVPTRHGITHVNACGPEDAPGARPPARRGHQLYHVVSQHRCPQPGVPRLCTGYHRRNGQERLHAASHQTRRYRGMAVRTAGRPWAGAGAYRRNFPGRLPGPHAGLFCAAACVRVGAALPGDAVIHAPVVLPAPGGSDSRAFLTTGHEAAIIPGHGIAERCAND